MAAEASFRELVASKTPHSFKFTIDNVPVEATFTAVNHTLQLKNIKKGNLPCITIMFKEEGIELSDYYLSIEDRKTMCPELSHHDFFNLLDVVANMYGTSTIFLFDTSYVNVNGFEIPKHLIIMIKKGLSFYNRYGFTSVQGLEDKFHQVSSQKLKGITFKEASEILITQANDFHGTEEEREELQDNIHSLAALIREAADEQSVKYQKKAVQYAYRMDNVDGIFHITSTSSPISPPRKGGLKKTRKRRQSKKQ